MGWWDNIFSSRQSNEDPLRGLDPSLREFLDKESPARYKPSPPPRSPTSSLPTTIPPDPSSSSLSSSASTPGSSEQESSSPETPDPAGAPSQSLYDDGRYAHLWKTYRPKSAIEAESKSDQEKLQDVLDAYKDRKSSIGRAAFENCSFEFAAIDECYMNGSWKQRLMMCRPEKKSFDKCYMMQTKFLKALGYMSTSDRTPEVEESIQMHADMLYHRMLDQERAIETAKAAGEAAPVSTAPLVTPPPDRRDRPAIGSLTPTPGVPPSSISTVPSPSQSLQTAMIRDRPSQTPLSSSTAGFDGSVLIANSDIDPVDGLPTLHPQLRERLNPQRQKEMREKLKDMTPLERELEQAAFMKETDDAAATSGQLQDLKRERKRRREAEGGRTPMGEWIVKKFGWTDDVD